MLLLYLNVRISIGCFGAWVGQTVDGGLPYHEGGVTHEGGGTHEVGGTN